MITRENLAMVVLTPLLIGSFLVLVTALKADRNMLKVFLAGAGFVTFGCLYAALLVTKFKGLNS
jgi:hypothetical protein